MLTGKDVGTAIEWTHDDQAEEDALLGTMTVYGVHFHVQAVRVTTDEGGLQVATRDPYDRLGDAYAGLDADACWQSVTLPGREGEWVLFMYPFAE